MRGQVEVGAVGDALELVELLAAEVEPVLDVDGALGVVRQLLLRVLVEPEVLLPHAQVDEPVPAGLEPVVVPLLVGPGLDEELHLHLLELPGAEDEVARGDLVAERLAGLGDAERRLLARRGHHVEEVDEDPLSGLGPQVVQPLVALHRPEERLEQAGELARLGERALGPAVRAVDVLKAVRRRRALLGLVRLLQVVGPEALVARLALRQRVGEGVDVTGRDPDVARQDDCRVQPDDVLAALDHRPPPLAPDVLLQLDAERAVVPGGAGTAVDLAAGVDETAPLAEADDLVVPLVVARGSALGHDGLHPAGCRR